MVKASEEKASDKELDGAMGCVALGDLSSGWAGQVELRYVG